MVHKEMAERTEQWSPAQSIPPDGYVHELREPPFVIDLDAMTVRKNGTELALSTTEFRLLAELVRYSGRVLPRHVLLARVWDFDFLGSSRLIDMAVCRLREKVEDDPSRPRLIVTVRGVGYRFEPSG